MRPGTGRIPQTAARRWKACMRRRSAGAGPSVVHRPVSGDAGRVVPEVGQRLDVAGLAGAEGVELEPVGTGGEAAGDLRRDPDHVALRQLELRVLKSDPARAGRDHVELLLVAMPVPEGQSLIRAQPLIAHAAPLGAEILAREPGLERLGKPVGSRRVLDVSEIDLRVGAGHGDSRKGGYWSVTRMNAYAATRFVQRKTPRTKSKIPRG